jgi:hypothetical protein
VPVQRDDPADPSITPGLRAVFVARALVRVIAGTLSSAFTVLALPLIVLLPAAASALLLEGSGAVARAIAIAGGVMGLASAATVLTVAARRRQHREQTPRSDALADLNRRRAEQREALRTVATRGGRGSHG